MITRRSFVRGLAVMAATTGFMRSVSMVGSGSRTTPKQLKGFCIDFNWLGAVFAPPGHWAYASPEEHVRWYEGLGANVIQTFAVSCNGYAWYKGGFVPPQPGLKHDFLPEVVRLAHKKGMLVTGYHCIAANSKWGNDHPDLSYGTPSDMHIPLTNQYLDYLSQSIADGIRKTGVDGAMIDWVWNPRDRLREKGWLPAERELFSELTGKSFPASGEPSKEDKLDYERKAIDRCWASIKAARDETNPQCVLWLSVNDITQPSIHDSAMLKEVDWLLNESPDRRLYEEGRRVISKRARMLQNVCGWAAHNAKEFLGDPKNQALDIYGFAEPRENSLPLPIDEYLSKPIDAFTGQDRTSANNRNIAAIARFYRGLPLDVVMPSAPHLPARLQSLSELQLSVI